MLQVHAFTVNMIQENCYLLWDETNEATLIDCGAYYPEEQEAIQNFITEHGLRLVRMLNTHGHFDHIFGTGYIYKVYGLKTDIGEHEKETYEQAAQQMKLFIGIDVPIQIAPIGSLLHDGDEIRVGNYALKVIETPGHTPGGVCFYCEKEKLLFSGDTLFRNSVGRCDLPGGSERALIQSLHAHVLTLPSDVVVYPGHGPTTTIGGEQNVIL